VLLLLLLLLLLPCAAAALLLLLLSRSLDACMSIASCIHVCMCHFSAKLQLLVCC
jgi:hypothetical protein